MRRLRATVGPGAAGVLNPGLVTNQTQILGGLKAFALWNATGGSGAIAILLNDAVDGGYGFAHVRRTSAALNALETDFGFDLPAYAKITGVLLRVATALTGGGTTTNVGFGTTADPDAFGLAALTANATSKRTIVEAPISGITDFKISACTSLGAAGDTALTVGTVTVDVWYDQVL